MKIAYVDKRFGLDKLVAINHAERICTQYDRDGYDLTLRQLYYVFVAQDLFPDERRWRWTGSRWVRDPNGTKNAQPNYDWLGETISDARLAGLVDWDHIVDRTRDIRHLNHVDSPAEAIAQAARRYYNNMWDTQPGYVEVWVEKDALVGIVNRAATAWDVPFFSCRGYTSSSSLWGAAQRLGAKISEGKNVTILHLGDHDPSGIDMTRDIEDRLGIFFNTDLGYYATEGMFNVDRIALNMDQVRELNPPPSPAKVTDPRAKDYIRRWGDDSWELDALPPETLDTLIQSSIQPLIEDQDAWDEAEHSQQQDRELMNATRSNWHEVVEYIRARGWVE